MDIACSPQYGPCSERLSLLYAVEIARPVGAARRLSSGGLKSTPSCDGELEGGIIGLLHIARRNRPPRVSARRRLASRSAVDEGALLAALCAFGRRPLPRAYCTFIRPISKGPLRVDLTHSPHPRAMTGICVRREKAALSSGCKSHPANAPAGSNRSSHGGDEMAEAFGVAGHI